MLWIESKTKVGSGLLIADCTVCKGLLDRD